MPVSIAGGPDAFAIAIVSAIAAAHSAAAVPASRGIRFRWCRCGQTCQSRLGSVQPPGIGAGERPPRAVAQCGARRAVRPGQALGYVRALDNPRPLELRGPWIPRAPISNVKIPRLWAGAGAVPGAGVAPCPGAGVWSYVRLWVRARSVDLQRVHPGGCGRWSPPWPRGGVEALELALDNPTSVGVARSVDLQRVPISNVCTQLTAVGRCAGAVHPGAGIGIKAAVEATTPEKPSSTHQKATVRLSRLLLSITSQGQPRTHVSQNRLVCLGRPASRSRSPTHGRPCWRGTVAADPIPGWTHVIPGKSVTSTPMTGGCCSWPPTASAPTTGSCRHPSPTRAGS